ncbi:hypothetical protein ACNKHL_24555 [Shigella flexneri]
MAKGSGPDSTRPKTLVLAGSRLVERSLQLCRRLLYLPRGTIKATLPIETLPAVFQMDEILHALRDHIVGLNCGRWHYIFSYIKTLKTIPSRPAKTDRQ